jgi:5-methyltetrahydrofolate--homocysteine methyltransferase
VKEDLSLLYADLERDKVIGLVKQRLADGDSAATMLQELREGMLTIFERYEARDYSQVSVYEGTEIYKEVKKMLAPSLSRDDYRYVGKVVAGQAFNDIHDKGITLLSDTLESVGFEVFNLGASVPPEKFVEVMKETGAEILCIGATVTNGVHSIKTTVDAVHAAGLHPKIMVGGGATVESLADYVGADAQAQDMVVGARKCLSYVAGGR